MEEDMSNIALDYAQGFKERVYMCLDFLLRAGERVSFTSPRTLVPFL